MSTSRDGRPGADPDRGRAATIAELSSAAEAIRSYQGRVGALASSWRGPRGETTDDAVVSAIQEAERSLSVAERAIRRALKVANRA